MDAAALPRSEETRVAVLGLGYVGLPLAVGFGRQLDTLGFDINAGRIADGEATIEDVGWELFRFMLDVASGKKKTWAEQWKLHNALVLFNPAPVT
jgi:UDP-N-acetyl-D-mannosaminuronate dehydrogenase